MEHDLFRCYAAELEVLIETIRHLDEMSEVSAEFRTLVSATRHLFMLHEHLEREEDVIFPYVRLAADRGYEVLLKEPDSEW